MKQNLAARVEWHAFLSLRAGESYWVFDAEMQIRGPESIRSLGLSASGIQAALRWGHDSNYNTYFFKSGSYWRFSPRGNRVESDYPRSMQDWSGIPDDVDAAFRDIYGTENKRANYSVLQNIQFINKLLWDCRVSYSRDFSSCKHNNKWKLNPHIHSHIKTVFCVITILI